MPGPQELVQGYRSCESLQYPSPQVISQAENKNYDLFEFQSAP
jgi:hypothetical protein